MMASIDKFDAQAAIKRRFGSVAAFERAAGLPRKSVHDLLRGRKSAKVEKAVKKVLIESGSERSDNSASAVIPHRQSGTVN
ncbi:hypothetical protein [Sphingomonas sp. Marseille-Q8236]